MEMIAIRGDEIWFQGELMATIKEDSTPSLRAQFEDLLNNLSEFDEISGSINEIAESIDDAAEAFNADMENLVEEIRTKARSFE